MGILDFFRKKDITVENVPEVMDKNLFLEEIPNDNEARVSSYIMPQKSSLIEEIFEFLSYDYESRGYGDALIQPDSHYMSDNIELLKNDYQLKIDLARHKFKEYLTELDFHILTREALGLNEVVEQLKAKRTIVNEHLSFIEIEHQALKTNTGKVERIRLSYIKGFKRGVTALSTGFLSKNI